jgi:hypothetical protein
MCRGKCPQYDLSAFNEGIAGVFVILFVDACWALLWLGPYAGFTLPGKVIFITLFIVFHCVGFGIVGCVCKDPCLACCQGTLASDNGYYDGDSDSSRTVTDASSENLVPLNDDEQAVV